MGRTRVLNNFKSIQGNNKWKNLHQNKLMYVLCVKNQWLVKSDQMDSCGLVNVGLNSLRNLKETNNPKKEVVFIITKKELNEFRKPDLIQSML